MAKKKKLKYLPRFIIITFAKKMKECINGWTNLGHVIQFCLVVAIVMPMLPYRSLKFIKMNLV